MKFKIANALIILFCSVSLLTLGQTKKQTSSRNTHLLPVDTAVRTGKLQNGFTYYVRHNSTPKNRVFMHLVNKVGSVLEDEDQRGLAHFMEHMNFNGTVNFQHNELVNYLQKAGVRFGADINAHTSFNETVYELPLPSNKPSLLDSGLLIMYDWAQGATLDPVEIDKERGVILEEERLGKGVGQRMESVFNPFLLNHSIYAERLPIGVDTVLNNFKRPTIERFYKDWYRPDLQALIVVGDINADSIVNIIKQRFSNLKNPVAERARIEYTIPLTGKNQFLTITDKEMTNTEINIFIKHKEPELKTKADYRKNIVLYLFNYMLGDKYDQLGYVLNRPYIVAHAGITDLIGGLNCYNLKIIANPQLIESGFKTVWEETEKVKKFGFNISELERAKESYLKNMTTAFTERNKTNSSAYVSEYQANFMTNQGIPGIEIEYQLVKNDLRNISVQDVNEVIKEYITDVNRDIIVMAPDGEKSKLPKEEQINNWINEVRNQQLKPDTEVLMNKPLLASDPAKAKIVSEERNEKLGVTTMTFSNGIKVLLKPTNFKNDEVIFSGFAPGGTSLVSDEDYQSAINASWISTMNGLGNYNVSQLSRFLDGKQLLVTPYIDSYSEGIKGYSTKSEFTNTMMLIYAYFTQTQNDTARFNSTIARLKINLINEKNSPENVFSDTISAVLGNHNPRLTGNSIEKLNQINVEKAYAIYKSRFADASNFTFVLVGSFEIDTVKPLLLKYLGGLPSTYSHETVKDLHLNIPEGKIVKTVHAGSENKATVHLIFSGKYNFSRENNLAMNALKESIQIRLLERLREEESGVYSPQASVGFYKIPEERFTFNISFGCAPKNVDKLIASALDELEKLKVSGPLQLNIDKYKAAAINNHETQIKTDGWWLNYLKNQLQNNEPLEEVDTFNTAIENITVTKVKDMATKYLNGDNYIRLVLLPEKIQKSSL